MHNKERALLLSIRPRFVDMILSGVKTVELRRVRPKIEKGEQVIIYVSSPVKAIIGGFSAVSVIEDKPDKMWSKVKSFAGINRLEYDEYFEGAEKAYGIVLENLWVFKTPLELNRLRNMWYGFTPPQSYRYLNQEEILDLNLGNKYSQILRFPSTRLIRDMRGREDVRRSRTGMLKYKFGY